jgi:thymidylate synthase (FAD)
VNMTFTMNARALMHLLNMRMKGDAQWEVRELSESVLEAAKEWMPYTFERYEEKHPQPLSP